MQAKFRTVHYSTGTYLVIEDSDGADLSILMQDGETLGECLARRMREEQHKINVCTRNINRMKSWESQLEIA